MHCVPVALLLLLSKFDVWYCSVQILPKTHIFQLYFQLYLVCRHEMHIIIFVVLKGSFSYAFHACTSNSSLIKIWYLMYIEVRQYYQKYADIRNTKVCQYYQKIHIFSGIFIVVFSLQAWNQYHYIRCFKRKLLICIVCL